jgi:hypothetical protein
LSLLELFAGREVVVVPSRATLAEGEPPPQSDASNEQPSTAPKNMAPRRQGTADDICILVISPVLLAAR